MNQVYCHGNRNLDDIYWLIKSTFSHSPAIQSISAAEFTECFIGYYYNANTAALREQSTNRDMKH